ncbi:DUF4199 domain-containing protein [Pontibacter silvestris]|uniref:DUF4199 domain-containing protein n=1 Tax=Pontibacter silvestris TaxID=2305183 RepID=A0ABW4WT60_9BACT|nr:DUF4199 domain-containing protein [Pontibacter silvestris]MCC9136125.1 DUF4199 domain-containing protein [Pontibacter silvestris]
MIEKEPSVFSVALKYGFVGALIGVVYSLILMVTNLNTNPWLSTLSYVILIGTIVVAMQQYKKSNYGYMSYGQGLGIGTLVSAMFGVFGSVFTYIYTTFVDPNFMDNMMEQQRIELENRGMSDEQIDQAIAMSQQFASPALLVVWGILLYIIVGFILSLIVSAIMKNSRPEFE